MRKVQCWKRKTKNWAEVVEILADPECLQVMNSGFVRDIVIEPKKTGFVVDMHLYEPKRKKAE